MAWKTKRNSMHFGVIAILSFILITLVGCGGDDDGGGNQGSGVELADTWDVTYLDSLGNDITAEVSFAYIITHSNVKNSDGYATWSHASQTFTIERSGDNIKWIMVLAGAPGQTLTIELNGTIHNEYSMSGTFSYLQEYSDGSPDKSLGGTWTAIPRP